MAGKENERALGPAGMSDPREMLDSEMSRRGASPVLVGRAAEMAALEAAFEAVRQGGPAAVLIGGEAGVGKTRLIGEFAAGARAAGARVLTGGCLELGADGLPFGPFTAMLRDLVREVGADEITGTAAGQRPGHTGAGPAAARARGRPGGRRRERAERRCPDARARPRARPARGSSRSS